MPTTIVIPKGELWDERRKVFVSNPKPVSIQLEHSLVSISKWESHWHKPFLTDKGMTFEETIDYIRCMTLTKNVDPIVYSFMSNDNIKAIKEYIEDPMTATWFSEPPGSRGRLNGEQVTSELIYYWMIVYGIPSEYQKWHFNRLYTLIKICNIKNQPPKKMGRGETIRSYAQLNAERKKMWNTKG